MTFFTATITTQGAYEGVFFIGVPLMEKLEFKPFPSILNNITRHKNDDDAVDRDNMTTVSDCGGLPEPYIDVDDVVIDIKPDDCDGGVQPSGGAVLVKELAPGPEGPLLTEEQQRIVAEATSLARKQYLERAGVL